MRISESVPLWLLYEDEFDAWRAKQSAFVRQWLIEQNFKGEKHRVLLLPDSGGALEFAIAGPRQAVREMCRCGTRPASPNAAAAPLSAGAEFHRAGGDSAVPGIRLRAVPLRSLSLREERCGQPRISPSTPI
jgi:hypothetical protein